MTPQNVALLDAVKGIAMFRKQMFPFLGCGKLCPLLPVQAVALESHIFGTEAQQVAGKFEVELLGHIPIYPRNRSRRQRQSFNYKTKSSCAYKIFGNYGKGCLKLCAI